MMRVQWLWKAKRGLGAAVGLVIMLVLMPVAVYAASDDASVGLGSVPPVPGSDVVDPVTPPSPSGGRGVDVGEPPVPAPGVVGDVPPSPRQESVAPVLSSKGAQDSPMSGDDLVKRVMSGLFGTGKESSSQGPSLSGREAREVMPAGLSEAVAGVVGPARSGQEEKFGVSPLVSEVQDAQSGSSGVLSSTAPIGAFFVVAGLAVAAGWAWSRHRVGAGVKGKRS
ncbi:MAG: hypothetical protein QM705_11060 [Ancrocorticia sp.]